MENEAHHLWLPLSASSFDGKSGAFAQSCPCGEVLHIELGAHMPYENHSGTGDPACTLGALFKGFLESQQIQCVERRESSEDWRVGTLPEDAEDKPPDEEKDDE